MDNKKQQRVTPCFGELPLAGEGKRRKASWYLVPDLSLIKRSKQWNSAEASSGGTFSTG